MAVLLDRKRGAYVVLASTDCEHKPTKLAGLYQLRPQIELLFRNAKQFAGFAHCQARSQEKLDIHFNMSLAAVGLAQLEIQLGEEPLSLGSYVRRAYNRWLAGQLLSKLDLAARFGINHPRVQQVVRMGSIAG